MNQITNTANVAYSRMRLLADMLLVKDLHTIS